MAETPQFEAISFNSCRGVNPILIYRLRSDPSKCFKFIRRRNNSFKCERCARICAKDTSLTCHSIIAENNKFGSDPEQLNHHCIGAGLLFNYDDLVAQQCYREGLSLAKREQFQPQVVDQYVKSLIEKRVGTEAAQNMQGLVDTPSRYSNYRRKLKKNGQGEAEKDEGDEENDLDIDAEQLAMLRQMDEEIKRNIMIRKKRERPEYVPQNGTLIQEDEEDASMSKRLRSLVDFGEGSSHSFVGNELEDEPSTSEQNGESLSNEPFTGEFGYSKSNKCPILIYRSRYDPSRCFTFQRKRLHNHGASYQCVTCTKIYHKDTSNTVVLDKVDARGNVFVTDPEKLFHYCVKDGKQQTWMEVMATQIQRAALVLAEEEALEPSVVDSLFNQEIVSYFGADAEQALATMPERLHRLKSFRTRKNVNNPECATEKQPKRITDSGYLYESVLGYSKDGRHSIMIVRRSDDPSKAYVFVYKAPNWFQCSMCLEARKNDAENNKAPTIKVTDNYFHTDPEEYEHSCVSAGYELPYAKVVATQCYREGLRMADDPNLDSNTIDDMVLEQIRKNFPDSFDDAVSFLPTKQSRFKGYRNHRSNAQQKRQLIDEMGEEMADQEQDLNNEIV